MLRHSKPVQPHYLFILYPALFLSVGVAVDALIREAPRLLPALHIQLPHARRLVAWGALAAVLLVALGQATQATLFIAALGGDQVNTVDFGYPLNQLLAADSALTTIQRSQRAGAIVVSMPSQYTASAIRLHSDSRIQRPHRGCWRLSGVARVGNRSRAGGLDPGGQPSGAPAGDPPQRQPHPGLSHARERATRHLSHQWSDAAAARRARAAIGDVAEWQTARPCGWWLARTWRLVSFGYDGWSDSDHQAA